MQCAPENFGACHGGISGMSTYGKKLRKISAVILALMSVSAVCSVASAQQPSQAQISAVRSSCRSDYMAHCSSVPSGGKASLACLQKNIASLSPGCKTAVDAIGGGQGAAPTPAQPAAAPAESAPAVSAPPAPAATPSAPATAAPAAAADVSGDESAAGTPYSSLVLRTGLPSLVRRCAARRRPRRRLPPRKRSLAFPPVPPRSHGRHAIGTSGSRRRKREAPSPRRGEGHAPPASVAPSTLIENP